MQESTASIAADRVEQRLIERFTLGGLPKRLAMQVE